jgi:hypothetical protein
LRDWDGIHWYQLQLLYHQHGDWDFSISDMLKF